MINKKLINFLFFFSVSLPTFAQKDGYKFYTNLDSIKKSGFYNIVLSPAINAKLKTDYSDVRIINNANKWVPHVFHSPVNEISRNAIQFNLKFSLQESNKTKTTIIINATKPINNIELLIKNTSVQKFCTLSGSNDNNNWFIISDSILLNPIPSEKSTVSNLKINFVESNYTNFKLVIYNRNKDPYNVLAILQNATTIGFFSNFIDSSWRNPVTTLVQKDSGKFSYIKINQQKTFHFNEINIKAEGIKYYNRNVDLYISDNKTNSFTIPGRFIQSFSIANNSKLELKLPTQNAPTFYLTIHNEDNPALQINEVNTILSYRYITAYLEKDNDYKLIMGNEQATLPNYDITKDYPNVKDSVTLVNTGKIFAYKNIEDIKTDSFTNSKWIIWAAIIFTLLILLFLTKSMITEVNKEN